jgi:hypothetical protein
MEQKQKTPEYFLDSGIDAEQRVSLACYALHLQQTRHIRLVMRAHRSRGLGPSAFTLDQPDRGIVGAF